MIRRKCYIGLAVSSMIMAGSIQGASITAGGTDHLIAGDVNDPYVISVNANNAGYANAFSGNSGASYIGTTTNMTFNGPIVGYHFVNVQGGGGARVLSTVVESGGIVAKMTSTDEADNDGFDSFGQNALDGYTATDPGTNLLTTVESRNFTAGIRDLDDFSGSVDISGMTGGSIYVFYGQYNAAGGLSLTATMTDAVLSDIVSGNLYSGAPSPVGGQNIFATRIDFINDSDYDSIDYTSNGSRLVGVVVTTTPPPVATTIIIK